MGEGKEEITRKEVEEVLRGMKKTGCPGWDEWTVLFILEGGEVVMRLVLRVVRWVWKGVEVPEVFRREVIVPTYKRGNRSLTRNYI